MTPGAIRLEQVSVVVQGLVDPEHTRLSVESVRRHLPGAEIIVSTWEGADVSMLPAVEDVVYSKDPGPQLMSNVRDDKPAVYNNVNRQIVSSAAGIALATRPMVLRIRSDLVLTGANGFLNAFGVFESFDPEFRFVQQRIIGNSSASRNPDLFRYLFHPSDFFFFGTRSDIEDFFRVPLYSKPRSISGIVEERSRSSAGNFHVHASNRGISGWLMEFIPEVYLFRSFLLKHGAPVDEFSCYLEYSEEWKQMSTDYLLNQFVFLDDAQLGIRSLKMPDCERDGFSKSFDFACWRRAYAERFGLSETERELCGQLAQGGAGEWMSRWIKRVQVERPARGSLRALLLGMLEAAALVMRGAAWLSPLQGSAARLHKQLKGFRRLQKEFRHA
jgi:hypothetical protein